MATDKETAHAVLEELTPAGNIRIRAMMGDYVVYYREKVIGGIYDGKVLLKKTESATQEMPDAKMVVPYPGAKEMPALEDFSDAGKLRELFEKMSPELPAPRRKRKSGSA